MSARILTATEAKNRFGHVLREVARSGGPIFIKRRNKPVAVIISIDEYERLEKPLALPAERHHLPQDIFGMWSTRDDIDDAWLDGGCSRWRSTWHEKD